MDDSWLLRLADTCARVCQITHVDAVVGGVLVVIAAWGGFRSQRRCHGGVYLHNLHAVYGT